MNASFDRKYVIVLAALAVVVLAVGALLKPGKPAPEPPSPSETATLQARVRREELSQTASYFAQRAQSMARDVFYDADHESSAVAWERPGQVLTTAPENNESLYPPLALSARSTGTPPVARPTDQNAGRWLLIVGRAPDGQLLWTPAVYGGMRQTTCAGEGYNELIVNARLDAGLSGAGVFDLDGVLVAIVARCNGTYHLVSVASVPSLLQAFDTPDRRVTISYGFRLADLSAEAKRLFSIDSGLFVTEVTQGDAADHAGLEPGDVITQIGGQPVTSQREVTKALGSDDESARVLEILRNRRKLSVLMPPLPEAEHIRVGDALLGIHTLPLTQFPDSVFVAPGTPAYKAGLRTGDHVIRIGMKRNSTVADLNRAILTMGDQPLLIVYQRGRARRAALVSR